MLIKQALVMSVAMPLSAYATMSAENEFMSAFDDKPETPAQPETPAPPAPPAPAAAQPETPAPAAVQPIEAAGSAPAQPVEVKPPTPPNFVTREELAAQERARKAEAELEALRGQQPTVEIPDPKTDPEGFREYERQVQQVTMINERLNMSELFERRSHGDEKIDTVQNWFLERSKTDPQLFQRVVQSRNPYGTAITEYDNEQLLVSFKDPKERAAYQEWKTARANPPAQGGGPAPAQLAPSPAAAPAAAQPKLPTSIASMPSAGGGGNIAIPVGNGSAFDQVFN